MKSVKADESWLVVLYSLAVHTVTAGFNASFSIIVPELVSRRNFSRLAVASVVTTLTVSWRIMGFFTGGVCALCGYRIPIMAGGIVSCVACTIVGFSNQDVITVFFFLGIVSGLGRSLMYLPTFLAANTYFKSKRQLANGIVMSGSAVGMVVFPPLVAWLLENFGLQGTFFVLGGIMLNITVLGALFPPLEDAVEMEALLSSKNGTVQSEEEEKAKPCERIKRTALAFFAFDLFTNWKFAAFVASTSVVGAIGYPVAAFVADFVQYVGHPRNTSWIPITVSGVTNSVARLAIGIHDKPIGLVSVLFVAGIFVDSACLILLIVVQSFFWLICADMGVFGLMHGIVSCLHGPLLTEIVSVKEMERAAGMVSFFFGIFMLFSPVQGTLFDLTGEYTWTFLFSAIRALVGGLILLPVVVSFSRCF